MTLTARTIVCAASIIIPLVLLAFGIYGSFSFTFSAALIWQVGVLGLGADSLGVRKKSFFPSILTGIILGVILAFAGGAILKALGLTDYSPDKVGQLNSAIHSFGLNLSFKGELGFKLLSRGNTLKDAIPFLAFCIFLIGLGEEIFWRGLIQRKISQALPKNLAIFVTSVIFGLVHFYLVLVMPLKDACLFMALIALSGVLWGYLYERFDNIWGPAISHGITAFIVWKYFVFV